MPLKPNSYLKNRYYILHPLKKGGMGQIFLARDTQRNQVCVVKSAFESHQAATRQFWREAKLLSQLRHPVLPQVTDYVVEGQQHCLIMEYIPGDDLSDWLKKYGHAPEQRALRWVDQILTALIYLHSRRPPILHRDIKPANIKLMTADRVKLVDFGIARTWEGVDDLTRTGARAISPHYSPWEQYGGTDSGTGPHSDIYALGATLYTLLAGQPPPEAIHRMDRDTTRPLQRVAPDVSRNTIRVIERAIAIRREDRWATAEQMRRALRQPTSSGAMPTQMRLSERYNISFPLLIALVLSVVALAFVFWLLPDSSRTTATPVSEQVLTPTSVEVEVSQNQPEETAASATLPAEHSSAIPAQSPTPPPAAPTQAIAAVAPSRVLAVDPQVSPTVEKASPTPTPNLPVVSGKLAFPADNGAGKYDVYIVSMPDGQPLGRINGARQPNFRPDGAKLLVNGQGGNFGENVFEAGFNGSIERAVSGSPTDLYPSYNPDGNRLAYSNPQLAFGSTGYSSYIFTQCGLMPPVQENDPQCQDIANFGVLVPAGQIGEIQGTHPVWAGNDHIVYKGCNTWAGGGSCGVFTVASWANKRSGNGETPRKFIDDTSAIPTGARGNLLAYQSNRSGDWEAYVINLDGSGVVNISNSPHANDGLPTISPDGQWVAFASDRGGVWAIYAASARGGTVQKLFDFPRSNPWATGDRDWTNERISWGQ